jgi:Lecithin retinol acyltransferase
LPQGSFVDSPVPGLRIGDHLVSARRFIRHHGIYVGNGQFIHYGGLASGLQAGPVKVSSLQDFLAGHPYTVREDKTRRYSREESVERARARIGEDLYHPAFNNCEHRDVCITGKTRSMQVDLLFGLTGGRWGLFLSRSGPVLHALYRRIRANLRKTAEQASDPQTMKTNVAPSRVLSRAATGDSRGPAAEATADWES